MSRNGVSGDLEWTMRRLLRHSGGILTALLLSMGAAHGAAAMPGGLFDPAVTRVTGHKAEAERVGGQSCLIRFRLGAWPSVWFRPVTAWQWGDATGLVLTCHNPGKHPVVINAVLEGPGDDGTPAKLYNNVRVPEDATRALTLTFDPADRDVFWGMRGIPEVGRPTTGRAIAKLGTATLKVFLKDVAEPTELELTGVRLMTSPPVRKRVAMPFVDRFGQYRHADWAGKIRHESDLVKRHESERRELAATGPPSAWDKTGGWRDGPQLEATGWFRPEKWNGRWWLVTPQGRLFFSVGMDCIALDLGIGQTFVTGREGWFDELPPRDDARMSSLWKKRDWTHSMAERIGGKGDTISFYQWNLLRKYGPEYRTTWRAHTFRRLGSWGLNTIGEWADKELLADSPMPYTVSLAAWGEVRRIRSADGYWGTMYDVFDPSFARTVDQVVKHGTWPHKDKPLCIGYFFDTELGWETIREGVLASAPDQPARQAAVRVLRERHRDLAALNRAWGSALREWNDVRAPRRPNAQASADLDALETLYATTYFQTVRDAFRRYAPHQLYLGCRFALHPPIAASICAQYADVVSYNIYERRLDAETFQVFDRPVLIAEWHVGATDSGLFHPGLVDAGSQQARAQWYREYVQSALDCQEVVGCHWFQYHDEPLTGRALDGENYNVGFVDVTDTPYAPLVQAARQVHETMYERASRK